MPRIADCVTDCSIYLYHTEAAARSGKSSGGSGFLVHVPSTVEGYCHLYAVTNKHIVDDGCGVLRLNRKQGGIDTISTTWDNWIRPGNDDDVVVAPIDIGEDFQWWSVGTETFINQELIDVYRIGIGDEAFLVGRLVTHDGRQKNRPVVRFGNISLMADPTEKIQCEGYEQEGFLVECRSLSGFSGSPVFVTTTQAYMGEAANIVTQQRQKEMGYEPKEETGGLKVKAVTFQGTFGPWLLGIDWGHIPLWRDVYEKDKETKTEYQVEANTGIACVLPAWHVLDLLNTEGLVKERKREDAGLSKRLSTEKSSVNDIATEPDKVFIQSDFETALKKASRKVSPSQSDEETK